MTKKNLLVLLLLPLWLLLSSCDDFTSRARDYVTPEALKAHVAVLADDELQGRAPGTPGYDAAAQYVARTFQAIGLEPAGAAGTFYQPIALRQARLVEGSAQLILRRAETALLLRHVDDYVFLLNPIAARLDITAAAVYVGYGVTAPQYGLNSYQGLDVAGKFAVALTGVPSGLPPEPAAVLASIARKAADAHQAGARGLVLLFDDTKDADWAYAAAVYTAQQPVLSWAENEEIAYAPNGDLQAVIAMAPSAAARMFKGAEQSLADVFKAARAGAPSSGFRLDAALTARNLVQYKPMRSANIIARLDAKETPIKQINGAELPQVPGALMLVAHLDHLGVGPAINGDVIYNGALDNALGVASLVETAKALAALPAQWPRDVYFAALTGEEAGLIGAEYLVRHLPMPKLSAVLNIDMPVALYPLATLHASGATHSSLGAVANRAAQGYRLALETDPKPQEAIFIRSDHYAFVKQGIPALYLNIGITDSEGDTERGAAALNDFLSRHYHQPSDDLTRPINWQSAATFSDVHVDILRRLAQDTSDVRWTQGSFFSPSDLAAVSSD